MYTFSPNTRAQSAQVNSNFSDLASGVGDLDQNKLELFRKEVISDFISDGVSMPTSVTLSATISSGIVYVNGKRISMPPTLKVFTASQDTYVDIKDDGTYVFVAVSNGATTGMTLTTNTDGSPALRVLKVVTSGTAITSVVQGAYDPLNNYIGSRFPIAAQNINFATLPAPKIGVITGATLGSTGNKPVTGVGFKPKLVKFTVMPTATAVSTMVGVGAMTESSQYLVTSSANTQSNTAARNATTSGCLGYLGAGATTLILYAQYVSMNTDGFTINVVTASSTFDVAYEAYP